VLFSADSGRTFREVLIDRGYAPAWYPEHVTIGGVRGKQIAFQFQTSDLPWRLDEIAIVEHAPFTSAPVTALELRASDNPVRRSTVRFAWPFGSSAGDLQAFDYSGRVVWRQGVTSGGDVTWDLNAGKVPNGAYIVVARSGGKTVRLKLFVARRPP
jgi:hypothetical protein